MPKRSLMYFVGYAWQVEFGKLYGSTLLTVDRKLPFLLLRFFARAGGCALVAKLLPFICVLFKNRLNDK